MKKLLMLVFLLTFVLSIAAYAGPVGSSSVVANIPNSPGFPEGTLMIGDRILVGTPGDFQTNPSKILEYRLDGTLVREYEIQGELQYINGESVPFGIGGMARDAYLNVYVASTSLGVIKINWWKFYLHDVCMAVADAAVCDLILNDVMEVYAAIPDLPRCSEVGGAQPCSPTRDCSAFAGTGMPCFPVSGRPAMPNDMAFGPDGELYVSDTMQATIWRIPYGGGQAEIFFQDERLDAPFGPNGIRLSPDGSDLIFAVTGGFPAFENYDVGRIYRLPIKEPQLKNLQVLHEFDLIYVPLGENGELLPVSQGPDGIGFSKRGNLFVTLSLANQIAKLDQNYNEIARYSGPALTKDGQAIPWAGPATFVFDGTRLVFANHALVERDPLLFILGDIKIGELGERLNLPYK
jgi:hypothetical protein